MKTKGDNPGWIYEHKCRFDDEKLVVSSGKICSITEGNEMHDDNKDVFTLDLSRSAWTGHRM